MCLISSGFMSRMSYLHILYSSNSKLLKNFNVNLKTTDYTSLCTFVIKSSALSVTDTAGSAIQASTLMPLSTYQPYVHFVDEHNIITNGLKLPKFTTSAAQFDNDVITLNYAISSLPTNNKNVISFFKSFCSNIYSTFLHILYLYNDVEQIRFNIVLCTEQ